MANEEAGRAKHAVDWLVARARSQHPGEWEQALKAVRAADERHGFIENVQGRPSA